MVLPGLFSTMTGCSQRSCNSLPISRPAMSSGPPGGNGTTSLTGFEGKSCAAALEASANTHRRTAVVRLMIPPRRKTIRAGTIMVRLRRGEVMSGTAALRLEAGAVTAGLHYTVDTGVKPVNETFGPNNIRRRVSGEHEVRQMQIRDGRPLDGEFSLDVTGFEFVGHRTKMKDFFDAEELKRVYYPEVEALVKKAS